MARVLRLDRGRFLRQYWHYRPGEHVVAFGPTQRAGKSWLLFQLLASTLTGDHKRDPRAVAFCMKPGDATVSRWSEHLGFREVAHWPPAPTPWSRPAGYTLWPRHTMDPDVDNPRLRAEFRAGILDGYKRGNSILMLDEIYGIVGELGLTDELLAVLTRGGGVKCGAWMATQKPSGTQKAPLPGFVFNCPTHFFLAPDNDKKNRERYGQLAGGIDPQEIERHVLTLERYEFLYINAAGEMAILGP
ncbi:hypothetical protein GCM10009527_098220 [Actinomadura nitritigenes]|uniref:Uncharacterized protein n=1 Tax=Actinomadura nitritigenes TaxID=134602 RepID=A0ABS3QWB5_9ACTN|nr:hypothetical protein [Actinomadura nitritigenes]MBO2438267.1 hypothetical protein [Actinomadura nitritigenes]